MVQINSDVNFRDKIIDLMFLIYSSKSHCFNQKYSRLRCLLRVKGLVICFYLGCSGSTFLITKHK